MAGFVKVYGTILQSSVWLESPTTRVLWITMLALADSEGIVRASLPGLAHAAHIRTADCERALQVLSSSDEHSRTLENEGKRIEALEGGWVILNYRKYRELRTEDQIASAVRQQRKRERDRDASRDAPLHPTEAEAEADKEKATTPVFGYPPEFDLLWNAYPRKQGSNKKQTYRLYLGHLKAGIDFDTMHAGALRYTAYATAKTWIGTDFIKAAQVFFGRDQHFLLEWQCADLPAVKAARDQAQFKKRGYV